MDRVKELNTYVFLLVGFFILSIILENGLIAAMYTPISGLASNSYTNADGLEVTVVDARATRVNGYMKVKVKNTTGRDIDRCYAKMNLYNKYGLVATEYVEIQDFKNGEEKVFDVKFNAQEVERYEVELVETAPEESHILDFFGWKIDLTNFLNLGIDLTKIFPWLKEGFLQFWDWFTAWCSTIPAWAWWIAGGIVLWNLPKKYLFGIFPL